MRILISIPIFFLSVSTFSQKPSHTLSDSLIINPTYESDSIKTSANNIIVNLPEDEKNWWSDWLPFIATIIVAYAAYRGVIKQSKATSVSSFRVNWIEDLRVNYSNFLIALRNVDNKIRTGIVDVRSYSEDEDVKQLHFLRTKIKLMINHSEPEHIAFWESLTQYMQRHNEYYRGDYSEEVENELDRMRIVMEQELLTIFKKEWNKAKNLG